MHAVIFEGSHWTDFVPFALTRPLFCLRSGATTLLEKQLRAVNPDRLTLWVRPEMEAFLRANVLPKLSMPCSINTPLDDEPALVLAARTLHLSRFEVPNSPCVVLEEDRLIRLAYVKSPGLSQDDVMRRSDAWLKLLDLPQTMPQTRFSRHWADLISWNEEAIVADSIHCKHPTPVAARAHLVNERDIHASPSAHIGVNVVLDASKGPILIDDDATIGANSVIEGPCYIGASSRISPLTLIRPGVSIGPVCRVGGEVGNTIFQAYSNKSHDGFVGDSYIGEWVNLGAGTTTSNLKSTYGLIKLQLGSREVQSERVLLGCAIGDHAKTATYTQLTAGAYVGTGSMIAISDRVPRFVPSFSFWTDESRQHMAVDKAADVAGRMQSRRALTHQPFETEILHYAAKTAKDLGA